MLQLLRGAVFVELCKVRDNVLTLVFFSKTCKCHLTFRDDVLRFCKVCIKSCCVPNLTFFFTCQKRLGVLVAFDFTPSSINDTVQSRANLVLCVFADGMTSRTFFLKIFWP